MKVLLISANMHTTSIPTFPLGLACVAAATRRAGHEAALIDLMFEAMPITTFSELLHRYGNRARRRTSDGDHDLNCGAFG